MSDHQTFAASLLAARQACPPGLTTWNQSDPDRRFAVYRNNVMTSLIDALADNHPVTQALVGEEFFRAMAGDFARAHPPRSPVMAHYGWHLADFIKVFQPAASLPYLADVARLEMLRVQACHAADVDAVPAEKIALLLADIERLPSARFALQPSLGILVSPHAVVSLWAAHQESDIGSALARLDTLQPESAIVVRVGLDVETRLIAPGAAVFIQALQADRCLGDAAGEALAADAKFDLADTLGLLICSGAITAFSS